MRFIARSHLLGHLTYHLNEETENKVLNQTVKALGPISKLLLAKVSLGERSRGDYSSSLDIHPYPDSKQEASDQAIDDKGSNFGRIARAGLLDNYITKLKSLDYLGVKIAHWVEFFKAISETSTDIEIKHRINRLRKKILTETGISALSASQSAMLEILDQLEQLYQTLS